VLDGFALVPPTWEVPGIGESMTVDRFNGLDGAGVDAIKEDAFTVGLIDDGEAVALGIDAGVILDKGVRGDA
jgi:hypothetical protein